jgi:hypothetical protein
MQQCSERGTQVALVGWRFRIELAGEGAGLPDLHCSVEAHQFEKGWNVMPPI